MSKKKRRVIAVLVILVAAIAGLAATTYYYNNLPENLSQQETIVLGKSRFSPGSEAALRVLVRESKDAAPIAGATIEVSMKPAGGGRATILYEGQSDEMGTANVHFTVPDTAESNQILLVKTESSLGKDETEQAVTISRDYRILLTSDKPIYQPGQVIHLRALSLSTFDLTPAAGQQLAFTIADGKGNKVFREMATTSDFGVATVDFQLANEVNTGNYNISVELGNTSSEKTVTVEPYVLPKFAVELATDRPYYLPGEHVTADLRADYFFGKAVSEGEVQIEGFTFDVARNDVFSLLGTTDENGDFSFEFDLPEYIVGSDLEGGLGTFYLQARVIDQTKHSESTTLSFPVSSSNLVIEAIPESGTLRPGVENIVYVLTSYPDGSPAATELTFDVDYGYETLKAETGRYGLAEVRFRPQNPWHTIQITASDASGATSSREFYFEGEWQEETVLLRPDRPSYQIGDTMNLTILAQPPRGTVYLDVVREGQTVSTRAITLQEGEAQVALDLTPDLYGTLELHAYKILPSGTIARDTRLAIVDQADDLKLDLVTDQDVYRPGDTADLDIQVSGEDGNGVPAAVGLAIVDESVFALAQQDPGFAKLYFLLEQELLQPKYDLHGFSIPNLLTAIPVEDSALRSAQEGAAQASLSEAAPQTGGFTLQANSHQQALAKAHERQRSYFDGLGKGLFAVLFLLPLVIMGLSAAALGKEKLFWRSAGLAFVVVVLLALLTVSGIFVSLLDMLMWRGDGLFLIMALLILACFIGLVVYAWRRKDINLGWALLLSVAFIPLLIGAALAAEKAQWNPGGESLLLGLVVIALLPLAYLLRAAGLTWQRRFLPAGAAFILALFLIVLPLAGVGGMGAMSAVDANMRGGPVLMDDVVMEVEAMPLAAGQALPMPVEEMVEQPAEAEAGGERTDAVHGQEPPRLRQYFPETMLWLPDGQTDNNGLLSLEVPIADSITTWRLTALASSQDGRLGSSAGNLRVFQDFFVDLDLPQALTVGDEVAVPVGIFNYLPEEQTVRLEVTEASWFELLDQAEKEITIPGNDIDVVYFRIKAVEFGRQPFKVTAWGSAAGQQPALSDAIQKEVQVFPNGKEIRVSHSDRLIPGEPARETISLPADAVPGTQALTVKIYPGVVSQVVEGLDSILRMPNGCFEQTSSTTYPNVLVMDYLQSSGQLSPEVQFKAEDYLNIGYQRLTTFEVGGGGFSLFGSPPADRMLTAYGLQEFSDMSRVHEVDPALIERAARWLLGQQANDGSWENDSGLVHEDSWRNLQNDRLPVSAYIVWSLVEAGFGDDPGTQRGLGYIREFQSQAEDPYVLALVANALVAADLATGDGIQPATMAALDRLAGLAIQKDDGAYWQSDVATFIGSEGQAGSIETTALAALAFLRANVHLELANAALTSLIQQKDSFGTWYNTQATILALKALIETVRSGAEDMEATVTVSLNGNQTRTVNVSPENFDVVQWVTFDDVKPGENEVMLSASGKGNLMYQVTGSSYLPWDKLALYPEAIPLQDLVTIDVQYDRTELAVDDMVTVDVTVSLNEPGARAEWALIDLGIPPGFAVQSEDLAALVASSSDRLPGSEQAAIERFELTGRQILVYIGKLSHENPLSFSYRLKAKYPLVAQTPASNVYDYYNPEVSGEVGPQLLVVNG